MSNKLQSKKKKLIQTFFSEMKYHNSKWTRDTLNNQ